MHLRRFGQLAAFLLCSACYGDITTSPNGAGLSLSLTGATAASRWVGSTTSGAPVTGTFAIGDWITTRDGNLLICTVAGTPGTWRAPNTQALSVATDTFTVATGGYQLVTNLYGATRYFNLYGDMTLAIGGLTTTGADNPTFVFPTHDPVVARTYTFPTTNSTLASTTYVDSAVAAVPAAPRVLFTHLIRADSSSTDGTTDVLFTDTIPASTLGADGQKLVESELVTTVGSATASRRIFKYFDGTLIWDSGALTLALGTSFWINTTIYRNGAAEAFVVVAVTTTSASTVPYVTLTTVTTGFGGDTILKTSAKASGTGAASADISNKVAHIVLLPEGTAE